jgi:hypothetical protein
MQGGLSAVCFKQLENLISQVFLILTNAAKAHRNQLFGRRCQGYQLPSNKG